MSLDSESNKNAIVSRLINSSTGRPALARFTAENLEERTVAAAELFDVGFYKSMTAASRAFQVPYKRLRSRIQGHRSVHSNGGLNKRLDAAQTNAVIIWAHRQVLSGFHVRGRRLRQHVNAILRASGSRETVGKRWCQRFMKKYRNLFHLRKAMTRDAKRKGVQKRALLSAWFDGFSRYLSANNIKQENVYNFDETGFMIGYLQSGVFLWTFLDIEQPVLTDSNDKVLITSIDCISAAGSAIPPFVIAPGVQIPVKWVQNNLQEDTVISTSAKGYITDMIALEWIRHFDKHTKPSNPDETRVLLMDNHEYHHTEEFISYCYANNITIFPLPPNSTHYLQPLDVGVFGPFKHWHQEVLYREIAEGAYNFNKTDFFFHLQEIRDRTFKKSTILSAWAKSGLFPFNPAVVLDTLQDPLSSLTPIVDKTTLPGYIESGIEEDDYSSSSDETASSDASSSSMNLQRSNSRPLTPRRAVLTAAVTTPQKSPVIDWKSAPTPSLNIPMIERYYNNANLREGP